MAKFNQLKVGTKFKTFHQIFGWSEECTVLHKDSKTITYADFNGNERTVHKQDCGNVVVLNDKKPIDKEKIERIIAEKTAEALKLELKKLNDPYYLAFVDEHLKELDIEIEIGFKGE